MRGTSLLPVRDRMVAALLCSLMCFAAAAGEEVGGGTGRVAAEDRPTAAQTSSDPALERQADQLMAEHQYVAAIHAYEAIGSPPAPLLNKLGIAYEKMRLYDQAKLSFARAIESNPKFSGPENNLGTVYYVQGDYRRAERAYKQALKLDPRNASIYNNLGTLYFTRHKIHKGMEAYQQAVSLDPEIFQRNAVNSVEAEGTKEERALINYYLAQTCAQAGKNGPAILYLQRAVQAGFHDEAKLRQDRHFDAVRGTPEFQAVLLSMQRAETPAKTAP